MIQNVALIAIFLVALIHLFFMVIEATRWNTDFGRKITHLSEGASGETVGVGRNMALYNGFLGLLLLWGTFALSIRQAYSLQWFVLSFIAVAGLVGWRTMGSPRIALAQSVPALVALGLIWAARPYPRTEDEAIHEIIAIERQILALKSVDVPAKDGVVPRGQHPKMHGLVRAELTVVDNIPEDLRVGLFAAPPGRPYKALVRFSNARNPDDQDKGGHGMAIKLTEDDGATTIQDFVLFDAPAFFVGDPLQYVEFEEATLRGVGKSKPGMLATLFLGYYARHPRQFLNLLKTQRGDVTDPLVIDYWSVTPYSLGGKPVKYTVRPTDKTAADVPPSRDRLREAMKSHLATREVVFEFRVQTQSDATSMPVEDPTRVWDEDASLPRTVARLTIPAGQEFDIDERRRLAEHLEFTPWHARPEHEPLGGINRVRKAVYNSLAEFRHALNHDARGETPK